MAINLKKTDVVIVGLGAVGGVAALPLARAGLEVVGLEAGAWLTPRDFAPDELRNNFRGWPQSAQKANSEIPTHRPNASAPYSPRLPIHPMMNAVGGTSLHYWAQSWRLNPWDFKVVSETKRRYGATRLPKGMDVGLIATATYAAPVQNFPNGCHICELEIDEDTGEVEIVRYSVVDDVGTVINPLLLKGQIVGGVAQGVGQILMEDIQFDGEGQILTGSFMDYAMPRATDISAVEVKSNPVPTKTNPLGVKGAGEAGCVGAMPAVANALVDALSHLGIRHVEMPATPERLWRAISQANGK